MNSFISKCKHVLRICFLEPFSYQLHGCAMLLSFLVSEVGLFISINPTSKPISLLFGLLYALDLLPTLLNLLGIDQKYDYLGRDAFDPNYPGYAFFADGSWVSEGVMCKKNVTGNQSDVTVLYNKYEKNITEEWIRTTTEAAYEFARINNLILMSDYYRED